TYVLNGGTLLNTTVTLAPSTGFAFQSGAMDGVTINGDVSSASGKGYDGLTVNGQMMTNGGGLQFYNAQTLGGSADVQFTASTGELRSLAGPLTIGSGVSIRTNGASGNVIGQDATLVNNGTILANSAGATLTVDGNWNNSSYLKAQAGRLVLGGTWLNSGT